MGTGQQEFALDINVGLVGSFALDVQQYRPIWTNVIDHNSETVLWVLIIRLYINKSGHQI